MTIGNVNDAPIISAAIADQTGAEDTAWSYQVPAGAYSVRLSADSCAATKGRLAGEPQAYAPALP
jgi:hypothetical protein